MNSFNHNVTLAVAVHHLSLCQNLNSLIIRTRNIKMQVLVGGQMNEQATQQHTFYLWIWNVCLLVQNFIQLRDRISQQLCPSLGVCLTLGSPSSKGLRSLVGGELAMPSHGHYCSYFVDITVSSRCTFCNSELYFAADYNNDVDNFDNETDNSLFSDQRRAPQCHCIPPCSLWRLPANNKQTGRCDGG